MAVAAFRQPQPEEPAREREARGGAHAGRVPGRRPALGAPHARNGARGGPPRLRTPGRKERSAAPIILFVRLFVTKTKWSNGTGGQLGSRPLPPLAGFPGGIDRAAPDRAGRAPGQTHETKSVFGTSAVGKDVPGGASLSAAGPAWSCSWPQDQKIKIYPRSFTFNLLVLDAEATFARFPFGNTHTSRVYSKRFRRALGENGRLGEVDENLALKSREPRSLLSFLALSGARWTVLWRCRFYPGAEHQAQMRTIFIQRRLCAPRADLVKGHAGVVLLLNN